MTKESAKTTSKDNLCTGSGPVAKILRIIGAKWTLLVIHSLTNGTRRFGEIMNELPGISPRTLSARLIALEKNGIIKKKAYAVVPPKTEYSLTEKGLELKKVFHDMSEWHKKFEKK